jgi:CBS domain containing-hemolysin-like protein
MKKNIRWIITITLLAFLITVIFTLISSSLLEDVNIFIGIIIILIFIILGVLFDIIGVSVATSDPEPFHAMASKKVHGANTAKRMIKNADKVSSFCNDVIGDICNIISGSAGLVVATSTAIKYHYDPTITTLLITSIIAALTIGGKALGKGFAIKESAYIVNKVTKVLNLFKKHKKKKGR